MTEMTSYAPGTPCWVDLGSPDIDASTDFYGQLFGWEVPQSDNAEQTGGYRIATSGGKSAAGMMPLMQEGQPPAWSTYVSVEDADATAEKVKQAGGQVIAEPMDVMDLGRMAIFADPTGAVFGIWQPGNFSGAELVNEPNTYSWNELNTRDPDAAKAFYAAVFGWGVEDQDVEGMTYTLFQVADRPVAGAMTTPAAVPDEVPAFWLAYFGVEDCDATVARVEELGGSVMSPKILEMEGVGRFAIVADPHGAAFGVIAGANPDE